MVAARRKHLPLSLGIVTLPPLRYTSSKPKGTMGCFKLTIQGLAYPGSPESRSRRLVGPDWLFWSIQAVQFACGFFGAVGVLFFIFVGSALMANPRRLFRLYRGFLPGVKSPFLRAVVYVSPQFVGCFVMLVSIPCVIIFRVGMSVGPDPHFELRMSMFAILIIAMSVLLSIQYFRYDRPYRSQLRLQQAEF